ncbi:hypothetical protein V5O48_008479 [Marasmius crinis-equi]|uniref:Alcohol acetyltransferase n=1 Tax=Marasmius crinis-equi TaxID=585013 RepID=A0ABR3FDS5_9AGAR
MSSGRWIFSGKSYQRPLGESELAYYYPSEPNGLGDMFLHIAFRAERKIMNTDRVIRAWALLRLKHPLLMSQVVTDGLPPHFAFTPHSSLEAALSNSQDALYSKNDPKEKLISDYMDGPRTLSSTSLSCLVISEPNPHLKGDEGEYDLLMCAPHYLGDGASLHQCTHDLLLLLASPVADADLEQNLVLQIQQSCWGELLPLALENRLSAPNNRWAKAASDVNLVKTLQREIGGHTFSRSQRGPQRTVLEEVSFTETQTSAILAKCKSRNVTVNHALFALCNVAWGRTSSRPEAVRDPLMMYTAINLRPFLLPHPASTYWFVALSYYNVVLPAYLPPTSSVFWLRAQTVKSQTRKIVQSPFLPARALDMARTRAARVQGKPNPTAVALPGPQLASLTGTLPQPAPPSACLIGLSLIGNLDATYARSSYPSITLHTVTTASRQKAGGLLLLEHTFGKKLWLHLCWDENGFQEGQIENFWKNLQDAVVDYLI